MNARVLGWIQRCVLRELVDRPWFAGCGWAWAGEQTTRRIMDGLARRGLVDKTDSPTPGRTGQRTTYTINRAGREAIK